ncbi:hypothetical protein, partial [Providencia rettgeri]|uniref:hypothetical protein n=2 Tax=Providencia rettgeri TaxID=587 RepID=UPI0028FC1A07
KNDKFKFQIQVALPSKEKGYAMTQIQLLLLATNNIKNNTDLSHSQESYVYQYYYANVANQFGCIKSYIAEFIKQTSSALDNDPQLLEQRQQIYSTVERYLEIAEKRYIQRQKLLQKK